MEVARRSKPQAFERDRNRVGKQKYLRKKRRKGVQKKKIIDTSCENNINTVVEKPENRHCVVLLSMMKH